VNKMARIVKVSLKFNLANISVGMNTFYATVADSYPGDDAALLLILEDWIENIWSPIRGTIDTGVTLMNGWVDEIFNPTGEVLAHIGVINPTVNGSLGGDSLPYVDTGSMFARTNIPRVRGGKSIAGMSETNTVDGLFNNPALAGLAAACAAWIAGPPSLFMDGGVWSSKVGGFVPFSNGGGVTNVPGTRVSRRPGRGL
jgi:hypothetical protein